MNKLPAITLLFWVTKICATTLGETAGDLLSMTLNVGYGGARLYASHGTPVEVLDLATLKSVGVIPNTPRVHDILELVPTP